jgi:hypothetical protein
LLFRYFAAICVAVIIGVVLRHVVLFTAVVIHVPIAAAVVVVAVVATAATHRGKTGIFLVVDNF